MKNTRSNLFLLIIVSVLLVVSCSSSSPGRLNVTTTSPLPDAIETVDYPSASTTPFVFQTQDALVPVVWTFTNFQPDKPLGLSFNDNGTISGAAVLSTAGDYTFDVLAKDAGGKKRTMNFALKIWSKVLLNAPSDLPTAMPGPTSYSYNFAATGGSGTYKYTASSSLPTWLNLNQNTGLLTGVPPTNVTGNRFTFDVTVTCTSNSANSDTQTLSLSITPAEIQNFKGPSEVFPQETVAVTFDVKNHGSAPFTVQSADFTFTQGGGSAGNVNGEYNAIAALNNPSNVSGNSTASFTYNITVVVTPTKASFSSPVSVDMELTFSFSGSPMKTKAPNTITWASRIWETLTNLPGKRFWGAAAAIGTHVYYFGGMDDKQDVKYSIFDYDTATNTWTTLPVTLPAKSFWHDVVVATGKIYIVGGYDKTNGYKNVLEFNPSVPSITPIGTLNKERYMCCVASNGIELFVFGSYKNGSIEMFNLNTKISTNKTAAANNYGRYLNKAVYYKNKYYSFGGSYIDQYAGYDTVYEFDPVADSLTQKNSLIHEVTGHSIAQFGNHVYCIGGYGSSTVGATNHFQRYDLDTFTVRSCGLLLDKVYGHSSAVIGDTLYMMGGISTNAASATNICRMMELN